MSNEANKVIDKLERGEQPTADELRAAGYCLECGGYGWFSAEDGVTDIQCTKCDGTGECAYEHIEEPNDLNTDVALGRNSRPDVISGV